MPQLSQNKLKKLEKIANQIRQDVIQMVTRAGSGHPAGTLGLVEIFTAFYFHLLKHNPKKPDWSARDRLILSNGHVCPVRYAAMARAGYFPTEELITLRKLNSRLQGHPEIDRLPGLETSSGPLGEGTSQAVGLAYAAKMDKAEWRIFCVLSDGELQEGQTWETFLFAAKYKLNNCIFVLDRNKIQIEGKTEKVMPLEPLADKFKAFNLDVEECDGNDLRSFISSIDRAKKVKNKPTIIIAHTVPGKGVSFMENNFVWHGKPPSKIEAELALNELKNKGPKS